MALGRLSNVRVERSNVSVRAAPLASRYSRCDHVVEGRVIRLAFKRYSDHDATVNSSSRTGVVMAGSENRVDVMSKDAYGVTSLFWVLFMFNRLQTTDLNPFLFKTLVKIGVPSLNYVAERMNSDLVGTDG